MLNKSESGEIMAQTEVSSQKKVGWTCGICKTENCDIDDNKIHYCKNCGGGDKIAPVKQDQGDCVPVTEAFARIPDNDGSSPGKFIDGYLDSYYAKDYKDRHYLDAEIFMNWRSGTGKLPDGRKREGPRHLGVTGFECSPSDTNIIHPPSTNEFETLQIKYHNERSINGFEYLRQLAILLHSNPPKITETQYNHEKECVLRDG